MLNASFTSSHLIHSTTLYYYYYYYVTIIPVLQVKKLLLSFKDSLSISILLSFSRQNNSLGRDAYITPNYQPWHYMTVSIVFTWGKKRNKTKQILLWKRRCAEHQSKAVMPRQGLCFLNFHSCRLILL